MSIKNVTNAIREARADYMQGFKQAQQEYKDGLKRAAGGYIGKLLLEENARLKRVFDNDVERLQKVFKAAIVPELEAARDAELDRAKRIDANALNELRALQGLPLSTVELDAICTKYGSKNSYTDKLIKSLAEANGINPTTLSIAPNLNTRLEVLAQLSRQADDLLKNYSGQTDYKINVLLSDSVLLNAEQIYNGGSLTDETSEMTAKKALLAVQNSSAGAVEKSIMLKNIMNNFDETTRADAWGVLASNNVLIDNTVLELAGCAKEVQALRRGDSASYAKAQELVNSFKSKEELDFMETEKALIENKDNPYLPRLISSVAKTNQTVAKAALAADLRTKSRTYNTRSILVNAGVITDGNTTVEEN